MADDDDDFGGFAEAQPSCSTTNNDSTPDWLLESFTKSTCSPVSLSSSSASSTAAQPSSRKIEQLEEQLKKACSLIQAQQENYQNLQKQFEILRLTNLQANKELESSLKNANLKQIKLLHEENEKLFEQKLNYLESKLEKSILKANAQLEEKFEKKLVLAQEQLIKHYESQNEVLELRFNKTIKSQVDDQLSVKLKQSVDSTLREYKIENDKLFKQQYLSLNESFKEQIKSNIEQENLILKDLVNKKLEKLIKNYEIKHRNTSYLYSRQLTNLSSFLDNAKTQIDLMQNHIKKSAEISIASNDSSSSAASNNTNNNDADDDELADETLLNM